MIMCFSPDQRISIDVNNILEVISSIIVISSTFHIGLTKQFFTNCCKWLNTRKVNTYSPHPCMQHKLFVKMRAESS